MTWEIEQFFLAAWLVPSAAARMSSLKPPHTNLRKVSANSILVDRSPATVLHHTNACTGAPKVGPDIDGDREDGLISAVRAPRP